MDITVDFIKSLISMNAWFILRRVLTRDQSRARTLVRKIKVLLRGGRLNIVADAGVEVDSLLASDLPFVK